MSSDVLKVELHTHTSDDPVDTIPHAATDLIDRAALLGYDALAITLHDKQLDVTGLSAYAEARRLVLIPGIERTIEGKHVLLLNFSAATEQVDSFEDLARLKRAEPGGLVIAPHPFFPHPSCLLGRLDRHADLFDAVEWNAMYTPAINFNRRAERWAGEHGKPIVGNGDVHRLEQLGTTYSLVDAPRDPAAICRAIAEGYVRVETAPLRLATAVRLVTALMWPQTGADRPRLSYAR